MQSRKYTPLAKVTVTTAGTRVRATVGCSDPTAARPTPSLFIQAAQTNTGYMFVGLVGVSSAIFIVSLAAGEAIELGGPELRGISGEVFTNDYYIDASVNGEWVMVSESAARRSD